MKIERNTPETRLGGALPRRRLFMLATVAACLIAASVSAQTAGDTHKAVTNAPPNESPAKIIVDPPLAEQLSHGAAVVHYRTENLRIAALFGPDALSLSPRVGHLHVNVENVPWVWAHSSREPVIVVGLSPGPHTIRLQLMTANHQWLDEGAVEFTLPYTKVAQPGAALTPAAAVQPLENRQRARIIIDSPLPEPLARGVVFIRYRTENIDPPASGSVPSGHVRVRVDDATWHWADKTGSPVIVQGLAAGRHKIRIELANDSDQVIDHGAVDVLIPAPKLNKRKDVDK